MEIERVCSANLRKYSEMEPEAILPKNPHMLIRETNMETYEYPMARPICPMLLMTAIPVPTLHKNAKKSNQKLWMNILNVAKESYNKWESLITFLPHAEDIPISTDKLRDRLQNENLPEEAITDCEDIVRSELLPLQQQLSAIQQQNVALFEAVRQLKVSIIL